MSKKMILVLLGLIFLFAYHFAFANVEINEIMYDLKSGSDDGREWVEIYNNADTPVDISAFRFFEGDTNHKLKLVEGTANILPHGYALLVEDPIKFKNDWPSSLFSLGTILDSNFSLNNAGENIAIKNGDALIDQYSYKSSSGGAGDGKSLQKINGVWTAAAPTPGQENKLEIKITKKIPATGDIKPEVKPKEIKILPVAENTGENPVETAAAIETKPVKSNSYNLYLPMLGAVVFMGLSAGAVYFIRRKKDVSEPTGIADDYNILDE